MKIGRYVVNSSPQVYFCHIVINFYFRLILHALNLLYLQEKIVRVLEAAGFFIVDKTKQLIAQTKSGGDESSGSNK